MLGEDVHTRANPVGVDPLGQRSLPSGHDRGRGPRDPGQVHHRHGHRLTYRSSARAVAPAMLWCVSGLPPGPAESPALQTARWLVRPIAFLESCRDRFGDSFSVRFLGFQTPLVMVSDPDVIRAIYSGRENGLPPGRTFALRPIMGPQSVLLLEGADHLARRRVMLPPFHGERMRAYEATVREIAERDIQSWPLGSSFALHPRMQGMTLEVILRAVFGVTDPQRRDRLRRLLPRLLENTSSASSQFRVLLARRVNRPGPLAQLHDLTREIDRMLLAEIAERRRDPAVGDREDILSMLTVARFEDGTAMEDQEVRDQLVTLLLAGHETTATALAWTVDLLLHQPASLRRLTVEVDGASDDTYLRAVIQESLRLRPVVPLAGRRLASELRVGGLMLPAGTDVTPAIWLTHTRPDLYPEPLAFRPERFLDRPPTTYGWIPFGGGVRRCLGAAFAELEMRVVLSTMLRRRVLHAASPHFEHATRRNVTLSPRHGTRVRISLRPGEPRHESCSPSLGR
ncbi:MAG: cytochrome P450 [Solirubrobacteraceae bacterium]